MKSLTKLIRRAVELLAPLLLGEKLTPARAACAALGFAGILIVARPDPANLAPGAIAAALAGGKACTGEAGLRQALAWARPAELAELEEEALAELSGLAAGAARELETALEDLREAVRGAEERES